MSRILLTTLVFVLPLTGCSFGRDHQDLYEFMEEARNAPQGEVEPLPTFSAYATFRYSALALRSPFEPPLPELADSDGAVKSSIKPDESRQKEYLEGINFASFSLVGSLEKDGRLWSLINDGDGGIHRVTVGNYLGKNHGRIVSNSPTRVEVVEIVPDGKGNWLERPRTLALSDKD